MTMNLGEGLSKRWGLTSKEDSNPTNNRLALTSSGIFTQETKAARRVRDKLAADAVVKFNQAQADRWKLERQWYLNLAFYYGQHYVKFRNLNANFDMYVPPAPYYRVRPVINQVRKVVRKEISRLTAQKPNAYVIPASMEDRDIFAAQAAEQIWSSLWRQHKINRIVRQAVFWQATCGVGWIKQFWDWTKKDPLNKKLFGDIVIKAETPFHVFVPDLKEEILEDQPYVIHAQVKTKSWIENFLGIKATAGKSDVVDESLLNVMGISDNQHKRDTSIVLEFWVKPGFFPELPEGGMFTVAENKIVQGFEGWPYDHDEYPFSKIDGMPTGKFYADSVLNDIIPLQRELNRTRGQIIEAKNKMAKPQLLAEEGSILASKITSEPGQVITYKLGMQPPQPLPIQNLPSYVSEEVQRLYTDIADLSGQHEVSQGQTPPGVTAAVAISFLQETDESMISTHYDSLEEGIEKTASHCLSFAKMYWDEPRTIRLVGLDNTFDVQTFKGSDLGNNLDIHVEAGSALPTSRAAKQAFITDLMKMGFVPPQEGLEILEIGGLKKIYERIQVDTRQAQRENLRMRVVTEKDVMQNEQAWMQRPEEERTDPDSGLPLMTPLVVPTNTYDNHQVHIEMHNRYRKSQAFEMAPPEVKKLFEEHVKQHHEALMVGIAAPIPTDMSNPLEGGGEEEQMTQEGTGEQPALPGMEGMGGDVAEPNQSSY